jgi:glycosyltransferase 2 family protein
VSTPQPTPVRSRPAVWYLQLLATVALVAYILYRVPLRETGEALLKLDLRWVLAALLGLVVQRVIFVWRWHVLLPPVGVRHSFWHTQAIGAIGYFYSTFTPATLGSDVSKVVLMASGHGASVTRLAGSVLADRVAGVIGLLAIGAVCLPLIAQVQVRWLLGLLLIGLVVFLVLALLLARLNISSASEPTSSLRRLARRVAGKLAEVAQVLVQYRAHPGRLAVACAISCAGIVATGATVQCLAYAFHFPLPLTQALVVVIVCTVVGLVPVTLAGLGWTEGALLVTLVWAGMGRGDALALAALNRVASTLLSLAGGALLFFRPAPPPLNE